MIVAERLTKVFRRRKAVDGFSFEVREGEIYGLLGPNGAGKTTTVRMLAALLRPTSGRAEVAGYDVLAEAHRVREQIGILTESPGLYLRLTPLEYLDFFGQVHGMPRPERSARVEEVLRLVGMWERARDVMRSFSKGMQQRVAIARVLLHRPRVLFFDEPTAALDPEAAKGVRDHLAELARAERCTVLLCTHNLPEAERLCQRLSIVHRGHQVAEGTAAQLKSGVARGMNVRLRSTRPEWIDSLALLPGVQSPNVNGQIIWYRTDAPERVNPRVVATLVGLGAELVGLEEEPVSLEDVYLKLVREADTEGDVADHSA